ncbi:bifunctional diguanylate cyclase/phosphodiesterase [Pseudoduganella umbonata]|uniref:Diguanylate cyclase (GGDEF)-like protein/PAS domain S-box-containing protein n=1 Tax=Pseudoduganella umbonata TaxID=864828 RepID=A0A4P8I0P3_9BURK|nr:EAL domain-containing protein [Pseudoduganella umbonata]MBB3221847.1 diguanylate cyclase (GGDEF)-like protein/PAS domain S-box-containing protein [Pseudoduganella umbonata]QCP14345.1 EAL domain-containing protein [Pseudoduganella umbonata]
MARRFTPVSLAAAVTLAAGLCVTGALFLAVSALEYGKQSEGFQQRANLRVAAIRRGLDDAVEVLTVTNQLFRTMPEVTQEQFSDFARPLLQRHPFMLSFTHQRWMTHDERLAFEARVAAGRPGFTVTEIRAGQIVPAAKRERYLVAELFAPLTTQPGTLGLDVWPLAATPATAERMLHTGKPAATPLVSVMQPVQRDSFVLLMPLYRPGMPTETPRQRRAAWSGETAALVRAPHLVHTILQYGGLLDDPHLLLRVYAGDDAELVYTTGAETDADDRRWFTPPPWLDIHRPEHVAKRFDLLGQTWHVRVDALPRPFLADHAGSLIALVGGLLFSLLAAALVHTLEQRSRRVQWLVDERTADLRRSNAQLNDDVAARKRTERALQESEHRFRRLLALSSDWYWEQDANFCFTQITDGFFDKARVQRKDYIGRTRWQIAPGYLESKVGRDHYALLQARQPFANLEHEITGNDGITRWFQSTGEPVYDAQGEFRGYRGTGSDITERKMTEQRIRHIAHHDALTGLPNRILLQDRLAQAVAWANRGGRRMWVLLIDLDRFKFVNDTLGHKAGDQLLRTIAGRLRAAVRESDTVARLSGDEFVVILCEHADSALVDEVVERIMGALAQPMTLEGKEFCVTCSIGVAAYAADGTPADHLIEHADIAMYAAKKLGRNRWQFYHDAMNEQTEERLRIEGALRSALERNEFVLHYQPQVDLASGRIVGMEALLRWQHPELGMVPPQRFIGLAEETGLIVPIGAWVLRTACAQAKAWNDMWELCGLAPLRVAVNLSARQFAQPDLVASIAAVLDDTGLPAACLDLELTESLFVDDVAQALDLLHQLKALGVALSIDDFGTGYSSFSSLRTFPIDVLKIDRSFVADIASDADEAAIVVSIIALAHNLKLRVIAEGVESTAQLEFLRAHGCDEMQGYHFSRPVPAEEFGKMIRSGRSLAAELRREPAPEPEPIPLPA